MAPKDGDSWFEDDELVRQEGILVSRGGGHEVSPSDEDSAADDYAEDPANNESVPGTVDDLPYDYGIELPRAADATLPSLDSPPYKSWGVGATGPASEGEGLPLGTPDEFDLWSKQLSLIEESDAEERHFAGLAEADIPRVAEASAEDSAEVLPDAPDGVSSTGDVSEA